VNPQGVSSNVPGVSAITTIGTQIQTQQPLLQNGSNPPLLVPHQQQAPNQHHLSMAQSSMQKMGGQFQQNRFISPQQQQQQQQAIRKLGQIDVIGSTDSTSRRPLPHGMFPDGSENVPQMGSN
jgi:hypothetical protein